MISTIVLRRSVVSALLILCTECVLTAVGVPGASAAAAATQWDGLELRNDRRVDQLFVRPDASLAGFQRVRLARLQVSFDGNWNPNRTRRGAQRLNEQDFARIRNTLADEFASIFAQELARGGYQVVNEAGEDVLDVQPFIINLFITAPGRSGAGSATYTVDPGRMTLVAELRDSETQTILARAIDAQRASTTGTLQITNNFTNLADARRIITRWASLLRQALDAAEGKPAGASQSSE